MRSREFLAKKMNNYIALLEKFPKFKDQMIRFNRVQYSLLIILILRGDLSWIIYRLLSVIRNQLFSNVSKFETFNSTKMCPWKNGVWKFEKLRKVVGWNIDFFVHCIFSDYINPACNFERVSMLTNLRHRYYL